jgi:hypothetical protein
VNDEALPAGSLLCVRLPGDDAVLQFIVSDAEPDGDERVVWLIPDPHNVERRLPWSP